MHAAGVKIKAASMSFASVVLDPEVLSDRDESSLQLVACPCSVCRWRALSMAAKHYGFPDPGYKRRTHEAVSRRELSDHSNGSPAHPLSGVGAVRRNPHRDDPRKSSDRTILRASDARRSKAVSDHRSGYARVRRCRAST